jgi:hypothetical protein
VFDRSEKFVTGTPAVSVQRSGALALNAAAYRELGEPDHVELLYDRARELVGIRRAHAITTTAIQVMLTRGRPAPAVVSGGMFLKRFGLQHLLGFRWQATMDDGVLCLNVGVPGTPIRPGPQPSNRSSEE